MRQEPQSLSFLLKGWALPALIIRSRGEVCSLATSLHTLPVELSSRASVNDEEMAGKPLEMDSGGEVGRELGSSLPGAAIAALSFWFRWDTYNFSCRLSYEERELSIMLVRHLLNAVLVDASCSAMLHGQCRARCVNFISR